MERMYEDLPDWVKHLWNTDAQSAIEAEKAINKIDELVAELEQCKEYIRCEG